MKIASVYLYICFKELILPDPAAPKIERKRQARGQARIKSLLEAAELVFARDGYHNATTNEISATAGVSPATLYQFFINKDAIANALALQYAEQLAQLHETMDFGPFVSMDLPDMVSALMDPLLNFHKTCQAFLTLLLYAPLSQEMKAEKQAMTEKFIGRLTAVLRLRNPKMEQGDAEWAAQVCMMVYKGFIAEISASSGTRKRRLIAEFKGLLVSYLEERLNTKS
jgi:AcrR family transcriptional regulator